MRVLWFSLSPCGSIRRNNDQHLPQGWMISLEDEIKKYPSIELYVAYFSEKAESEFYFDGVHYIPMGERRSKNIFKRFVNLYKPLSLRDKEKIPWMLDAVRTSNPDIIHIHGTEDSFGLVADYIYNIPITFSIQGLIAPYSEKYFTGIPKQFVMKTDTLYSILKNVGNRFQWRKFLYNAKRECGYLKKSRYIMGRTFWDEYCTLALNPNRQYFTVDEILRSQFYNCTWSCHNDRKHVKIVSTISAGVYKGIETVLRTAQNLKVYSDINFEWHIAGYDNKTNMLKAAEDYTGIHYSTCNIVLHGRIDADELSTLLLDSDIYVHASHIENSPNSVCEAMLVGMPIIASNTGGTSSMLTDGIEGLLVQDGDSYVLAGAITKLAKDKELSTRLGRAAQIRAMERHSPSRVAMQLQYAYHQIIKDYENTVRK